MKKRSDYIAIETGNYGYVTIELRELKDWVFGLSSEDLMQIGFTDEELRKVKKLFLRKQIGKVYSPLIYDFALSMINVKATEMLSLLE